MATALPQLIGIDYSPWTEKARWSLDHHAKPYRYEEHLLLFGMPGLRLRTGRLTGPLTVPALCDGKLALTDSWDIARHADQRGEREKLFPESSLAEIEKFNRLSEKGLDALRALVTFRLERDPDACAEALPRFVPDRLRKPMRGVVKVGIQYIRREFEIKDRTEADYEAEYVAVLQELKQALEKSGGEYLVGGRFSYADIAMAVVLRGVKPVGRKYGKIGPATQRVWGTPQWEKEFGELLAWRDRLYDRHRMARES